MNRLLVWLGGMLFGAGLVLSGMTDPGRVIGFLDFFGSWQPALAFVMGGAVVTFALGQFLLRKRATVLPKLNLPDLSTDPIERRLVLGSAIFGVGWGLGGFCPGPAIANLAALRAEAFLFVPVMLLGMFAAQRAYGLDR